MCRPVEEFVHIRVEHLHLDDDLPQIYLRHAKRQAYRYVPVLPDVVQELRTRCTAVGSLTFLRATGTRATRCARCRPS
jgi:hypothetical protein